MAPAGDTRFKRSDPMMIYFEVYDLLLPGTEPVRVQLEMNVTNQKTGKLEVGTGLRPVDSGVRTGDPVTRTVWDLSVDKLPVGEYVLEIKASDSAGHKTEWRATSFTIE